MVDLGHGRGGRRRAAQGARKQNCTTICRPSPRLGRWLRRDCRSGPPAFLNDEGRQPGLNLEQGDPRRERKDRRVVPIAGTDLHLALRRGRRPKPSSHPIAQSAVRASPTQATYPSGRIKTAAGAVTAPSAGSSTAPHIRASTNCIRPAHGATSDPPTWPRLSNTALASCSNSKTCTGPSAVTRSRSGIRRPSSGCPSPRS